VLGVKFQIKEKKNMSCQFGTSHEYISLLRSQRSTSSGSASVECHSHTDNSNFEYRRKNERIDSTSNNTRHVDQCVSKREDCLVKMKTLTNV
jgi:hypothetical protein